MVRLPVAVLWAAMVIATGAAGSSVVRKVHCLRISKRRELLESVVDAVLDEQFTHEAEHPHPYDEEQRLKAIVQRAERSLYLKGYNLDEKVRIQLRNAAVHRMEKA